MPTNPGANQNMHPIPPCTAHLLRNLVLGGLCVALAACSSPNTNEDGVAIVAASTPPADWMRVATLGGASVDREDSDQDLALLLNQLVEDGVTVVEVDSRLSEYLTEDEFAQELALMHRVVTLAKQRNLKTVWYYPSLEVLTVGGETSPSSMYKDHPDWVQLSADGQPNVFYGSKVFWVNPGDESAWMEPLSGWRDVYIARVKQIAQTGVDGVWLDVPLYNDIVGRWASRHPLSDAKFLNDTGLTAPELIPGTQSLDMSTANTQTWLNWRHHELDRFLKEVLTEARSVTPGFNLIVETVTMDYNAAVLEGLDGAFQGPMDGLWHVWEVDVVSDTNAMRNAKADDFVSLIAMYKFGRGADRDRAAWGFTYGSQGDDAELVMATAVAAQVNPYELKSPEMTTTVGRDYRRKMFSWLHANEDVLFRSESDARVLLLHSSASRDYIDGPCIMEGDCGVSLFATWQRPDPAMEWWTNNSGDSLYASRYMAEYRGLVKALVNHHIPFDLMPSRLLTATMLTDYDVVVAPSLAALSDAEHQLLTAYVGSGGHLLFTGERPGQLTERGLQRMPSLFSQFDATAAGQCTAAPLGTGEMVWCNHGLGQAYMVAGDAAAFSEIGTLLGAARTTVLETDAGPGLYFEVYHTADKTAVHAVNFQGGDGTFSVQPASFNLNVATGGRAVRRVVQTSPAAPAGVELPFTSNGERVAFTAANLGTWTLFAVEF